jgi:hypothetical protein
MFCLLGVNALIIAQDGVEMAGAARVGNESLSSLEVKKSFVRSLSLLSVYCGKIWNFVFTKSFFEEIQQGNPLLWCLLNPVFCVNILCLPNLTFRMGPMHIYIFFDKCFWQTHRDLKLLPFLFYLYLFDRVVRQGGRDHL